MIPILSRFRILESDLRASLEREANLRFALDLWKARAGHLGREADRLRDGLAKKGERR